MRESIGKFATHHWKGIIFIVIGLCLAGVYSAMKTPSSVFPQTNFPRVTIMVDAGEKPADEMMTKVTQRIERVMKDVPGYASVRSNTGRGSSVVDVFFTWQVDMEQTELQVRSRLEQVRSELVGMGIADVDAKAYRLTFSVFPIAGISLTSEHNSIQELTVAAEDIVKPRFLQIEGVAKVDLVGGREPEFHVIADPLRLAARNITLTQISDALNKSNLVSAAGLHEEKNTLYLTLVDGRLRGLKDIENLAVTVAQDSVVRIGDVARVVRGPEPAHTVVTADGKDAVLIMIRSQPDGSTLDIASALRKDIGKLHKLLPSDMKLAVFYDQSILVRDSVQSVWEAIVFGLILSVAILFLFLKDWGSTIVAIVVIPVTLLVTLLAMRQLHMTFNLMTLGGIASAIGLVIDDAIVVVEAIHTKMATGMPRLKAVHSAVAEILLPLTGSTLTPVVVFIPLAFLDGVQGVFFRALAITMTISLLMSLVLAVSLTPSLAAWIIRVKPNENGHAMEEGGFILRPLTRFYAFAVRGALRHWFLTIPACALLALAGIDLYSRLTSDFLPPMEEHGFVLDYKVKPPGTSLTESNRALMEIEQLLKNSKEDVESYSRRTGVALGLELTEPNAGDFLVKLWPNAKHSSSQVMDRLREKIKHIEPQIDAEFHPMMGDLISDLVSSPNPIEIKVFSNDETYRSQTAQDIFKQITKDPRIKDTEDGLIVAGPSLTFHVRPDNPFGLTQADVAAVVTAAKLGQVSTDISQGDRATNIRVMMSPKSTNRIETLRNLALKTADGKTVRLFQVADVKEEPGQLELHRENLRQYVAVTGGLADAEHGDLGGVMADVKDKIAHDKRFDQSTIEYGGTYKQQQDSFKNLMIVMIAAVVLIFTVLVLEFRSFMQPLAIVIGALLALIGTVAALYFTGTSNNIISRLGAIIGVGIVAKNGILMLDFVEHLRLQGVNMIDALVQSGRRRLRPVLMTSLAAALGMLPLAYGAGSGADMLRPLAIAVIGALCISVLLSLVATPTVYYVMFLMLPKRSRELTREEPPPITTSPYHPGHAENQ